MAAGNDYQRTGGRVAIWSRALFLIAAGLSLWAGPAWSQAQVAPPPISPSTIGPPPSQVAPPPIAPTTAPARISTPQAPAGAGAPETAANLAFVLIDVDVEGEFEEFIAARRALFAPFKGKSISVADAFALAEKLQGVYVQAGYLLARVVIVPQELEKSARLKMRVIDGFIERIDPSELAERVRNRVAAVLEPLLNKGHLTLKELERRLLLAGETPGLQLSTTFSAGKQVGGSVLILTGIYRPVSASIYGDSAIPKVLGTGQAVISASGNSWLGIGDQFSVQVAGLPDRDFPTAYPTRRYLSAAGSIPLGIDGWKLDIYGTYGVTDPRVELPVINRGLFNQEWISLSYEAVKLRDRELTFAARFEGTDQRVDLLAFNPPVPLFLDRVRPVRFNGEAAWRLQDTGTTILFGGTVSRGLDALGARMPGDPNDPGFLPLSRAGASPVFTKVNGHFELTQTGPADVFLSLLAFGQSSFRQPLLVSEQFDITGPKMLSGFPIGALFGDTAWALRSEIGRPYALPIQVPGGGVTLIPYAFAAMGERILEKPTAVEIPSIHAHDIGGGVRISMARFTDSSPNGYGFFEYSRRYTDVGPLSTLPGLDGWRIFTGALLSY